MNSETRTVDMQSTWDAVDGVDDWIEAAAFAVLDCALGQRCVTLIHEQKEASVSGKSLTYEDGLHYDGDTATSRDTLQADAISGEREITTRWERCEQFLAGAQCDADREHDRSLASERRWLTERRVAVKLNGLRMTQPGLLFAISHYVPFREKPRGVGCGWKGSTEIDGETWGIIEFFESQEAST